MTKHSLQAAHIETAMAQLVDADEFGHLLDGEIEADGFDAGDNTTIESVMTFEDAGVLTRDKGLVLRFADGAEFQITIKRTARALGSRGD